MSFRGHLCLARRDKRDVEIRETIDAQKGQRRGEKMQRVGNQRDV